jgi:hypothetical protein
MLPNTVYLAHNEVKPQAPPQAWGTIAKDNHGLQDFTDLTDEELGLDVNGTRGADRVK